MRTFGFENMEVFGNHDNTVSEDRTLIRGDSSKSWEAKN
jgi:hypothetical protein